MKNKRGWIIGEVLRGEKLGRKLGFPTINLSPQIFPVNLTSGVYGCSVKIKRENYKGALYFGPRLVLGEEKNVLEIYVLDFQDEIYGEKIAFQTREFIRSPLNFKSIEELKDQLSADIELVKSLRNV